MIREEPVEPVEINMVIDHERQRLLKMDKYQLIELIKQKNIFTNFNLFILESIKEIDKKLKALPEEYKNENCCIYATSEGANYTGTCASLGLFCFSPLILGLNCLSSLVAKCTSAHKKKYTRGQIVTLLQDNKAELEKKLATLQINQNTEKYISGDYNDTSSPYKAASLEFLLYESIGLATSIASVAISNQIAKGDGKLFYKSEHGESSELDTLTSTINNGVNAFSRDTTKNTIHKIISCCFKGNEEVEKRDSLFKNIKESICKKLFEEYKELGEKDKELFSELLDMYLNKVKEIIAENKIELTSETKELKSPDLNKSTSILSLTGTETGAGKYGSPSKQ